MAVLRSTAIGELLVSVTDEEHGEVEIALAGFESKYSISISTRAEAIKSFREIAEWLEGQGGVATD